MAVLSPETTVKELFLKACRENDLPKVQYCLALGADVNWRDEDYDEGWSGLSWAASENYGELLELLLAKTGVDVNIHNNNGWTPLVSACAWGHEKIVRRLAEVPGIQLNSVGQ